MTLGNGLLMVRPKVTVLMPVYNAAVFLRQAVDSTLCQSFRDFELLVIDDGSSDTTPDMLRSYVDPRLRLVTNPLNRGLIYCLNLGLELASGAYVARMDGDDVAHFDRLERQVTFLDEHPGTAMVGSWANMVDERGHAFQVVKTVTDSPDIYERLLESNQFVHTSVMFRAETVRAVGGYRLSALHAEDYDLWLRLSERYSLANIPEALVDYRVHREQISLNRLAVQRRSADRCRRDALERRDAVCGTDARRRITPSLWAGLRGRSGTLGRDYLVWRGTYERMGDRHVSAKLAWRALLHSPLCREAWRITSRDLLRGVRHTNRFRTLRQYAQRVYRLLRTAKERERQ